MSSSVHYFFCDTVIISNISILIIITPFLVSTYHDSQTISIEKQVLFITRTYSPLFNKNISYSDNRYVLN